MFMMWRNKRDDLTTECTEIFTEATETYFLIIKAQCTLCFYLCALCG